MAQPSTARPRFKLQLRKLDFLSLVDVPAQETASIRLIKRDSEPEALVARLVKIDESNADDPLLWCWAFTTTLPDGSDYHDRQGDAITADFRRVAEEFIKNGGAVDEMHDNTRRESHIAFAFPWDQEICRAMLGPEAAAVNKTAGLMVAIRPTPEQLAKAKSGEFGGVSIAGTGLREAIKSASQPQCPSCSAYAKSEDETCAKCGTKISKAGNFDPDKHPRDHGKFSSGGGGGGGGEKSEREKANDEAQGATRAANEEGSTTRHAEAADAHRFASAKHLQAGDRSAAKAHADMASFHARMASNVANNSKNSFDHEYARVAHTTAFDAHSRLSNAAHDAGDKSSEAGHSRAMNFHAVAGDDHSTAAGEALNRRGPAPATSQAKPRKPRAASGVDSIKPRTKKRFTKQAVLTSSEQGHQHQLDLDDPADQWFGDKLRTTEAVSDGAEQPHSHDWVFDTATGQIAIAESAGHSHTIDAVVPDDVRAEAALNEDGERCRKCGQMCEEDCRFCPSCGARMADSDSSNGVPKAAASDEDSDPKPNLTVIALRAPDSNSPPSEGTSTVDSEIKEPPTMATDALQILTQKHEALEKRNYFLEKFSQLTDAEKAHHDKLVGQDKDVFLNKSALERQVEISEIAKADEVIYTSPVDGEVFRKSCNPRELKVKKQADEATLELRLQKQKAADLELAQKGATVFTHIAKGAKGNIPGRLMKAINTEFTDPTEYEEVMEAMKALNAAMKESLSGPKGVTPHTGSDPGTPQSQLDALAKRLAADKSVPYSKGYTLALETVEGQRLYAQIPTVRA